VPASEQVPLQPTLAGVFTEDLEHPAVRREVLVSGPPFRQPSLPGRLVDRVQPVRLGLVRTEQPEIVEVGVQPEGIPQVRREHLRRLTVLRTRTLHRYGVLLDRRQFQITRQHAAVGVRTRAHPQLRPGGQLEQPLDRPASLVEQLFRPVAAQPGLQLPQVILVLPYAGQRHLM
jgi:hypothetical protein